MNPVGQVILDDAHIGRACVFADPSRVIVATDPSGVPAALAAMQQALASGHYLAGYFSYELGYVLEPHLASFLPDDRHVPLLWFGEYEVPPTRLEDTAAAGLWPDDRVYATPLDFEWGREAYRTRFDQVMAAIRAGDTYQVNLSMRARFRVTGNPHALYGQLRRQAGCAQGAFVDDGERQLLSLSPELFFAIDERGKIIARPMKGTAPRGADATTDCARRDQLQASPKNRAENLMIVDLIRNDLGRLAQTGTVQVPERFAIETYPTVHQMTSTIQATLRPGQGLAGILEALYPCGSVTGAPKIRAMEIIRSLETSPRGAYCGAIGTFAPDGSARFNVAIRTLTLVDGKGELGVGGAVVSDSDADQEYDECLLKARFYDIGRRPLNLIETMPYVRGAWPRRSRHLQRMQNSAATLGIPFDISRAIDALDAEARARPAQDQRVRLCLHEDGTMDAEVQAMPRPREALRFLVYDSPVRSDDPLVRHKTSWREVQEHAYGWACSHGADEAILLNERGEITEGTRTNVFIRRQARLLTPPLSSGVLPGCLRAELLESGQCEEAVLAVSDLYGADQVFLGNSLRGLVQAIPHRSLDPTRLPPFVGVRDP